MVLGRESRAPIGSFWCKLAICFYIVISVSLPKNSAAAPNPVPENLNQRLIYYGEYFLSLKEFDDRLLGICDQKIGGNRYSETRVLLQRQNSPIVAMAMLKILALGDKIGGGAGLASAVESWKNVRDYQVPAELQKTLPTLGDAKRYCDLTIQNVNTHVLAKSQRSAFEFISNYDIGYPVKFEGCQFGAAFPIFPVSKKKFSLGKESFLYSMPDDLLDYEGVPNITASCWNFSSIITADTLAPAIQIGLDFFKNNGFSEIVRMDERTAIGSTINISGRVMRGGLDVKMEKILYIGTFSILEVTISESADMHPSIIYQEFLNKIRRY